MNGRWRAGIEQTFPKQPKAGTDRGNTLQTLCWKFLPQVFGGVLYMNAWIVGFICPKFVFKVYEREQLCAYLGSWVNHSWSSSSIVNSHWYSQSFDEIFLYRLRRQHRTMRTVIQRWSLYCKTDLKGVYRWPIWKKMNRIGSGCVQNNLVTIGAMKLHSKETMERSDSNHMVQRGRESCVISISEIW